MVHLKGIQHQYRGKKILDLDQFECLQGEHWLISGCSGSGKTTLLHILAGLLRPTRGSVRVAGKLLYKLEESERDQFREQRIGAVFQQIYLLPTLTVAENILITQYLSGAPKSPERVNQILKILDITKYRSVYPDALNWRERLRVAIARAVVNDPGILLADEPTSGLNDAHCEQILDLFVEQARRCNATLVIATHDQRIQERIRQQVHLRTP